MTLGGHRNQHPFGVLGIHQLQRNLMQFCNASQLSVMAKQCTATAIKVIKNDVEIQNMSDDDDHRCNKYFGWTPGMTYWKWVFRDAVEGGTVLNDRNNCQVGCTQLNSIKIG